MDSFDFKSEYSIPSFLLSVTDKRKDSKGKEAVKFSVDAENFRLSLSYSNVNPAPMIRECGDRCIILLGSP